MNLEGVSSAPLKIPNKSLFKGDEVCSLTGVKPYVLRFWEAEFSEVAPITSSTGQKLYEHKDIEAIVLIKKMLFDEKITVERAKTEIKLRLHGTQSTNIESEYRPATLGLVSRKELAEDEIQALAKSRELLLSMVHKSTLLKQRHGWSEDC